MILKKLLKVIVSDFKNLWYIIAGWGTDEYWHPQFETFFELALLHDINPIDELIKLHESEQKVTTKEFNHLVNRYGAWEKTVEYPYIIRVAKKSTDNTEDSFELIVKEKGSRPTLHIKSEDQ